MARTTKKVAEQVTKDDVTTPAVVEIIEDVDPPVVDPVDGPHIHAPVDPEATGLFYLCACGDRVER